jgi:hypothetical protein
LIIRRRGWTFESRPAPESGFRIEGSVMRFSVDKHDTELIGFADFAHQFVSRVVGLEEPADHTAGVARNDEANGKGAKLCTCECT